MTSLSPLHYDPLDPAIRRDPYPVYARLREEAPVFRSALGFHAVSRYADCLEVLRHPEAFSSAPYQDLIAGVDRMGVEEGVFDAPDAGEPVAESLIGTDPPVHTRLRKIVNRGFTRSRIAGLEGRVREIARDLVDDFADEEEGDFMADFASPLPITVIAELLGVDPERRRDFRVWSQATMLGVSGIPVGGQRADVARKVDALSTHLDELVERRRSAPRDDLVSALCRAESMEEALGADEVRVFTMLLLVAGNETTTHLLGNAMRLLCERPELARSLAHRPERIPAVVEEVLRYDSPVHLVLRRARRDWALDGGSVPRDAVVAVLLAAANRDPRHFDRADRFSPERYAAGSGTAAGHLAFGIGHHHCLGAPLARLEARVALEVLLSRLRDFECREGTIEYTPSFIVRGPTRLRITWRQGNRTQAPTMRAGRGLA